MTAYQDTPAARIELDVEEVRMIRNALLIGLDCFGEVERVRDAYDVEVEVAKNAVPETLRPLHPTGSPDTICEFATALRLLGV